MSDTAPKRYLVRLTTLRGVFYLCSNVTDGVLGWAASDLESWVSRYQMLHAAKRQAQLQWNQLNRLFDPIAVEVITPMGETVWTAEDGGQAEKWRAKGMQP